MVVIGHQDIPYESVDFINSIDDIRDTKSNSTIFFDYDITVIRHLHDNDIEFGVVVDTLEEVVIVSNLGAKYIVIDDKDFAKQVQDIADNYLYDSKILVKANNTSEIEWSVLNKIDGVILWDRLNTH
jgi:hypothetical protein